MLLRLDNFVFQVEFKLPVCSNFSINNLVIFLKIMLMKKVIVP